ncbi:gastrin/cholecystokinin type B receptor [Aplysia californica]|uniref:Gastrin/cholecystokinin type B receptor n=1 Tax=Aplysia californica TaxID=6500 RepID=A0ABM1W0E9_APLCA|nr:gastrin/cholecystokinin type B receptor [Aplysia californica]XP_035828143.1 gastrin/cholecystokinin type B receptor [Aplysia californica]
MSAQPAAQLLTSSLPEKGFDMSGSVLDQMWNQSVDTNISSDGNSNASLYTDTTNPRLVNGVMVLLLLLLNLMGNGLVFCVYHAMAKRNVFSLFVKVLAVLDLVTALTTMLMDTMSKMRPLDERALNLDVLCKLTHFQVYATSLASGCVLTLIAYQRYRKICRPLKPSITIRQAKLVVAAGTVGSALFSVLALVINGPQEITIRMNNGELARVLICRYDRRFAGTPLQLALSLILLTAFSVTLFLTVFFYFLVYRALRNFERRNSLTGGGAGSCSNPSSPTSPLGLDSAAGGAVAGGHGTAPTPLPEFPIAAHREYAEAAPPAEERRRRYREQTRQSRATSIFSAGGGGDRVSSQMYKTFLIITVVFIVSYLPHLVVLILNKVLRLDSQVLTYTQRVFLELAYNCPYISTVANPVVYGFRSAEFRENCRKFLSCHCRNRRRRYGY